MPHSSFSSIRYIVKYPIIKWYAIFDMLILCFVNKSSMKSFWSFLWCLEFTSFENANFNSLWWWIIIYHIFTYKFAICIITSSQSSWLYGLLRNNSSLYIFVRWNYDSLNLFIILYFDWILLNLYQFVDQSWNLLYF